MLNQVILVGRAVNIEDDTFDLIIQRKDEGADVVNVKMENLKEAAKHLEVNNTVGVKARLRVEGEIISVIAEKITFINNG